MSAHAKAAQARSAASIKPADRPTQRRMGSHEDSPRGVRATIAPGRVFARSGDAAAELPADPHVLGCASVTEVGYEMYDMFGPYTEVVSRGAFDATLATNPLVEFTRNHGAGGGIPMAHTRNGTLTLSVDDEGLQYDAAVDPTRTDVADLLKALQRGDLAEASFKFRIVRGQWSPDYTEFRIEETDLDRGDVSSVNFGANPNATSALRSDATLTAPVRRSKTEILPDSAVEHIDISVYL